MPFGFHLLCLVRIPFSSPFILGVGDSNLGFFEGFKIPHPSHFHSHLFSLLRNQHGSENPSTSLVTPLTPSTFPSNQTISKDLETLLLFFLGEFLSKKCLQDNKFLAKLYQSSLTTYFWSTHYSSSIWISMPNKREKEHNTPVNCISTKIKKKKAIYLESKSRFKSQAIGQKCIQ